MDTVAIIAGILLTVIGSIDGIVAFWKRMTGTGRVFSIPADVVKVLRYEGKNYFVHDFHIAKFGAKLFADKDGVPLNSGCISVLETADEVFEFESYLEPHVKAPIRNFLLDVADGIREINSSWDDVNQILAGAGLILIGLGLLHLGNPFAIVFVFVGAFLVS